MSAKIANHLGAVRRSRGVGVSDLARRTGVSRQTIHAIEAGTYVPNTEVTLKLARELEVAVEDLFHLSDEPVAAPAGARTELLSSTPVAKGQAVRSCRVGERLVSVPVTASPYYLPEADGVVSQAGQRAGSAEVMLFAKEESSARKLVFAGCDPAIGLLANMVEKLGGVEIVPAAASSRLALDWLREGKVHVAGSHLEDPATGEFNVPYVRASLGAEEFTVITFAQWEEGFVTAVGNPLGIQKVENLTTRGLRFVNREPGSGSRGLLDRLLAGAGVSTHRVAGYDRVAFGHLAAAYAVMAGEADCCLATRSAARTFGLDFVPVRSERYDFVLRRSTMETPAAQAFLDTLQRAALRRKLEVLAGYDTSGTGMVVA